MKRKSLQELEALYRKFRPLVPQETGMRAGESADILEELISLRRRDLPSAQISYTPRGDKTITVDLPVQVLEFNNA